jgi:hypothetical protein
MRCAAGIAVRPAICAASLVCRVAACFGQGNPLPPGEPTAPRPPPAQSEQKPANRLSEIGPILSKCLQLPSDIFRPGMRVTVRIAFTRDGEILGEPRFTFTTPGVSPEVKAAYQRAAVDMLNRCTPLPITKELGGATAGRPFVIPIIDMRILENTHDRTS